MWKEQVDNGVAYLDEVKPGWRELIDLKRLDISSVRCCVLGQVFGDFHNCPLIQLSPPYWFDTAFDHGFYAGMCASAEQKIELEREWVGRLGQS